MPASLRAHALRGTSSRPYDHRSPTASPAHSGTQYLSRSVPPHSPIQTSDRDANANQNPDPDTDVPLDRPGLPTYAEYKRVETAYLQSLSPRKRDKALITQAMFDKIWDVLHQPDACTIDTPQFRFWVRKMFTLSRQAVSGVGSDGDCDWRGGESGPQAAAYALPDADVDEADYELERSLRTADEFSFTAVVLHENRPVAIMEQLYELFCYCHVRAGHGGRDKTCAVIREHYSWVPKELTAQFVKACPTCKSKRSGHAVIGLDIEVAAHRRGRGRRRVRAAPLRVEAEETSLPEGPLGLGWPTTGGPLDPANPQPCGVREREREWLRVHEYVGDANLPSPVSPKGGSRLRFVPTEDKCLAGGRSNISRALTLTASLFHPRDTTCSPGYLFSMKRTREEKENRTPTKTQLPSLASALSDNSLDDQVDLAGPAPGDGAECLLPPALRPLRLSGPVSSNSEPDLAGPSTSDPFQIDPALLELKYPPGQSLSPGPGLTSDAGGDPVSLGLRGDVASKAHRSMGLLGHGLHGLRARSDAGVSLPALGPSPSRELSSPDPSFERSAAYLNADGAAAATLPFSISTEFMTRSRHGSRYYRDSGPLAMLYHCGTDEVNQEFDGHGPFSFSIMTDA